MAEKNILVSSLSKTERLILVNQYTILKKLDPESDEMYKQYIDILVKGSTLDYSEIFKHIEEENYAD